MIVLSYAGIVVHLILGDIRRFLAAATAATAGDNRNMGVIITLNLLIAVSPGCRTEPSLMRWDTHIRLPYDDIIKKTFLDWHAHDVLVRGKHLIANL